MSPTQRSLKLLREAGWTCEIVENFNSFTKQRKDLFGFADLLCIKEGAKPLLVQVTASGWAARRGKILAIPTARVCLRSGFDIQVHGWRKLLKKRGGKARVWTPKIIDILEKDFDEPHST
jgi:hypothetical protein